MTELTYGARTDQRIVRIAKLSGEHQLQHALILASERAHELGVFLADVEVIAVVGEDLTLSLARGKYGCLEIASIDGLGGRWV